MNQSKRHIIIFFVTLLSVSIAFFRLTAPFLMDALMAGILLILFKPLFNKLMVRFPKRRGLNAFAVAFFAMLIILLPLGFIGYSLADDVQTLLDKLVSVVALWDFERLREMAWYQKLPTPIRNIDLTGTLLNTSKEAGSFLVAATQSTFMGASQLVIDFIFVFIFLIVFFIEGPALLAFFRRVSPMDDVLEQRVFIRLESVVDATIRGNVIVALVEGVYAGVILASLGYPSPILLALIATIFSFLPLLGVNTMLLPLGLFRIFTGRILSGVLLIGVSMGVMAVTQNLLKPKLVGDRSGLHPVYILVATLGGLAWLGLPGFVLGPVIAALFLTGLELYAEYFASRNSK